MSETIQTDNRQMRIHTPSSVKEMYDVGRIAALSLDFCEEYIKNNPNSTTQDIDAACDAFIRKMGGIPECIGYNGYQHATCISPNDVACHGIPGTNKLKPGDIVNVDLVVRYGSEYDLSNYTYDPKSKEYLDNTWLGDTSRTLIIGETAPEKKKLVEVAKNAMYEGIKAVRKGAPFKNIGFAIENYCRKQRIGNTGFSVIDGYCGHGISKFMHEKPSVEHVRNNCEIRIQPYQYFTIEPIIMLGSNTDTYIHKDGWTVSSCTGASSTQFEHTLGVDEEGKIMIFTTVDGDHEYRVLSEIFGKDAPNFYRGKRF